MIDVPALENPSDVCNLRMPLNMEVSLHYADDPDNVNLARRSQPIIFEYERVSVKTYRLGNLMNGIFKFVPVEFTFSLASVLYTSVH